jgi:hypothetical protein
MTLTEQNESNDFWRKWLAEDPTEATACMAAMPKAKLTLEAPRTLTAEDLHQKIGENGLLMPGFTTSGIQILQDGSGNRNIVQELPPTFNDLTQDAATSTVTDPDLATAGLDLCASCNAKVSAFLEQRRKQIKSAQSPFDSTGELSKAAPVTGMTQEDYRRTSSGLLTPEMAENPFVDDAPSLTLGGLRRPDAGIPDEQLEQLRQLMLARPVPKQTSHQLTQEQLRRLGWLGGEQDTESISPHRIAVGNMIIPDF